MLQQNKNLMLIQFDEFYLNKDKYMYFDTGRSIRLFDIPIVLPVYPFLLLNNDISWFI